MAAVSFVLSDLTALAGETRRKNSDVRAAIDKAQADARAVAPSTSVDSTPALQNALCLPFLLALSSGNGKLVSAALPPLLRLASSNLLSLQHVLQLLAKLHPEVQSWPGDVHIKVLQLLPALMLAYSVDRADFLKLVSVCARLAEGTGAVSNIASATLQQVFLALFDKLLQQTPEKGTHKVTTDSDPAQEFVLNDLEFECYQVFLDLNSVVYGSPLVYLNADDIHLHPQPVLEIIENILAQNKLVFVAHPELSALLRLKTVPALLKVLNLPQHLFPMIVRTLRIVHLLAATQLSSLEIETEILLSFTNHIVLNATSSGDPQDFFAKSAPASTGAPLWEKVLVLEMYKALFANFSTVQHIYQAYDNDTKKKNVLQELFMVLSNYLSNDYSLLFSSDTLQISSPSGSAYMSKQSTFLKVPVLDHLDKQDPPENVPQLYTPYLIFKFLINFADGVSDFVANLSSYTNEETLERDVDFITSLNEAVFPDLFQLFKKYIYCHMDLEYFHMSIRALQKYTHAIGLLGLSSSRDGLLLMLSDCIIQSPVAEPQQKKPSTSHNLYLLGESIVESISNTIQQPNMVTPSSTLIQTSDRASTTKTGEPPRKLGMRTFNAKQVICLRALSNLAISLGSTLLTSWTIIWITFQWVDYFLHGPDKFGGISYKDTKKYGEPKLTTQDYANIENSQQKFLDSVKDYHQSSFAELIIVLTELYERTDEKSVIPLEICPFNRTYFVEQLVVVAKLNLSKFLLDEGELGNHVIEFFTNLASDRSASYPTRIYLVEKFTELVVSVTVQQFKAENADASDYLAERSLNALVVFLDKLSAQGTPQEFLVLNCETEMRLSILSTLHGLIDEHDKYYQNSWDTVFKILNTVFVSTEANAMQDGNLTEKIILLISTSYDTLKLILDEFLSTLPFNQLKSLIDTLLNFCSQTYDLNISFSSVSYFWLISDCVRSNIDTSKEAFDASKLSSIKDIEQLEKMLSDSPSGSTTLYQALNIYLLSKLSNLSTDPRNEVREGATQTLFQILDVQGKQMQSWDLIYRIVLPGLLNLGPLQELQGSEKQSDAMKSLNLILSGLVAVFTKYMMDFNTADSITFEFWERLIGYFDSVLALHWKEMNLKVFQSFQDLLLPLVKMDNVPNRIVDLLFEFWVNVPIEYDFAHPGYQDSLATYNESFQQLYPIIQSRFSPEDANRVLSNLTKCARYPVLSGGQNDDVKPSLLQNAVLANLALIDKVGEKEEILAALIFSLAAISSYPYAARGRIEARLSKFEGKLKIPTFIAVSQAAFELLSEKLKGLKSMRVIVADNGYHRVVGSLLYLVRNKAEGISKEHEPLWVRCNEMILSLTTRLLDENLADVENDKEVWGLILECITVNFDSRGATNEEHSVKHYTRLTDKVLPVLFSLGPRQEDLVADFIRSIYHQSFLYEMNEIEHDLVPEPNDEASLRAGYEALANFDFSLTFGTTAKLRVYDNCAIRLKCLEELFRFAAGTGRSAQLARSFLFLRAAFTVRRFIADERLLSRKPLPKIQEREVAVVMAGLLQVQNGGPGPDELQSLYRLISQGVPFVLRMGELARSVQGVLTGAFGEYN